jgi:hypothetical protein
MAPVGAPAGRPQYPWLLGGYGPYRPPWNVAGVDYRTGIPEDKLARLRDWRTLSGPNLNVDLVNGTITFNADYVFDSYDFSLGTGAILRNAALPFGASNITFLNCNFALPAGNPQTASGGGFWSFADQGPANIIIRNCNFDGTNMPNMGAFIDVRGSIDLQYNWFRKVFEAFAQRVADDIALLRREGQAAAEAATAMRETALKVVTDGITEQNIANEKRFEKIEAVYAKLIGGLALATFILPLITGLVSYALTKSP